MRSKKLLILTLTFLVLGLMGTVFLAACGEEETTTTAAPTETTMAPETTAAPTETTAAPTETTMAGGEEGEELVIGAITSETGVNALTGYEHKWAYEKAAADINANGGIKLADGMMHKVAIKFVDDKSDVNETAAAVEKLIKSDGLSIILSTNTTPQNQAAATVAEQYQAYFHINTSWTDEAVPEMDFPGYFGAMGLQWSSVIFESALDSGAVAVGAAEQLPEADQPQKWAVIYENTPDGIGWAAGQVGMIGERGWEVVVDETFVEGNKDFSSIILKMKEAGADGLNTLIAPADGITLINQMKEQGFSPKYLYGFKGFWPVPFYEALGTDAEYIGHDGFWTETYPYPYAAELGQAFRDEHNGVGSVSIGLPYAACQILFSAIEKAGVFEAGPVRDEVFGGSFPGTTMGDIQYSEKGIADIPFLSLQWKNGGHEVVWPVEFQTQKTELFVPWEER